MHILCPHCHSPIELVEVPLGKEIVCSSCGSTFRLEGGSTAGWNSLDGRMLGKFQLLDTVGQGAFGTVYKARDTGLDRVVAIKVPRAGNLVEGQDLDRFLREARSVAQLRHPAIVSVHEVGQEGGLPYLVSDFVQGVTLAELLTGRRPTPHQAARMLAAVADALQYAHERGVVHRDVKPSNIMLGEDEAPYLMDFGLAKRDAGEITMTLDGQVLGTPAYMSPEQARGEAHAVDGRSDVYSLGVILYQMLTGELPFRGVARMLLHQVLHDEPRPPRRLNDRIPRDLETICLKAMAKEPRRRYQSAGEMAEDLRRFLRAEPIRARPVGRVERSWRWCRRNPALAASTGLAAVALLVITGLSIAFAVSTSRSGAELSRANDDLSDSNQHLTQANSKLEEEQKKTLEAKRDAEKALREKELQLALLALERAKSLMEQRQGRGAMLWLARALELAPPDQPALRQVLRTNLADLRGEIVTLKAVLPHADEINSVAFSPDGKTFATATKHGTTPRGQVGLWDTSTLRLRHPWFKPKGYVNYLTFGPDGKTLFTAGDLEVPYRSFDERYEIQPLDTASGKPLPPLALPIQGHHPVFSSDRKMLLAVRGALQLNGTLKDAGQFWDVAARKRLGPPLAHPGLIFGKALSPDGKWALTAAPDAARLWDTATARLIRLIPHPAPVLGVAFSPDGTKFLTVTGMARDVLRVWNTADQKLVGQPIPSGGYGASQFSPDSRLLVTGSSDKSFRFYEVATSKPVGLPLSPGNYGDLSLSTFSPDGKLFAAPDPRNQTVRLWEVPSGKPYGEPLPHQGEVKALAFSPDGQTLLTGSADKAVRLWELPPGRLRAVRVPREAVTGERSPDGKIAWRRLGTRSFELLDVATGKPLGPPLRVAYPLMSVVFGPDSKIVAATSQSDSRSGSDWENDRGPCEVRLWEARTGKAIGTPIRHAPGDPSIGFSPGGKVLLTAWKGGPQRRQEGEPQFYEYRLWEAATGKAIGGPLGEPIANRMPNVVTCSPDDRVVAVTSQKDVRVWELATGKAVATLSHPAAVSGVVFSPNGQTLVTLCRDNAARLWDAATGRAIGQPLRPASFRRVYWSDGHPALPHRFFSDRFLGMFTGRIPFHANAVVPGDDAWRRYHPDTMREAVLFSRDGKVVVTLGGSDNGTLRFWDVATAKQLDEVPRRGTVHALALSPHKNYATLLTRLPDRGKADDRTLPLIDARTGRLLGQTGKHSGPVILAAFSADEKALLTASDDRVARLWRVPTGEALTPPLVHAGALTRLEISPDGRTLLTVSDHRTVRLWDAATGRPIGQPIQHPDQLAQIDFSPDGKLVRTIGDDRAARSWDVATAQPVGLPLKTSVPFTLQTGSPALQARVAAQRAVSWQAPPPVAGDVKRVVCWAQVLTGMELSQDGAVSALPAPDWAQRRDELAKLGGAPYDPGKEGELLRGRHQLAARAGEQGEDWFTALWHLERLHALAPGDAAVRYRLGRAHAGLGHWAQAVGHYTAALDAGEAGPDVWFERGWAYALLGKTDEALQDLDRALKRNPQDEAAWLARYFAHARRGNWTEAELDLARAEQPQAALTLQLRNWNSGRWRRAIADYTLALGAGTTDWWVWKARARAYAFLGQRDDAIADYTQALARKADDWGLWNRRGLLYSRMGQNDKALADYSKAVALRKDAPALWYNRAAAYEALGQVDKAVEDYSRLVELQPKRNPRGWGARAHAYANLGQWQKAADDMARAIEQGANNPAAWHNLALLRVQLDDTAGYRSACADMVRRFGRVADADLANTVAWALAVAPGATDDPNAAVQLALRALATLQSLPGRMSDTARLATYFNTLGAALYRDGLFEGAVQALDQAVSSQGGGGTPVDWLFLSMAHHRLGHAEQARQFRDRAVRWLEQSTRARPKDNSLGDSVNWNTWLELQLLRREAEDLDARDRKALAELDKAIDKHKDDPRLWLERARFHAYCRQQDKAEADYAQAISLKPKDLNVRLQRVRFLIATARWDKAAADLAEAVKQRPRDAALRVICGSAYAEAGRWPSAVTHFDRAIVLNPSEPMTWYYLALARLGAGQAEEYRKVCAGMVSRFGRGPSAQVVVQACRLAPDAVADLGPVVQLAEQILRTAPSSYPLRRLHGQILYRKGEFAVAARQLEASVKAWGHEDLLFATDAFYLAMAHRRLDHTEEARRWLDRAVRAIERSARDKQKLAATGHGQDQWYNRLVLQLLRREAEGLLAR